MKTAFSKLIFYSLTLSLVLGFHYSFSLIKSGDELTEIKKFGTNKGNLAMYVFTQVEKNITGKRPLLVMMHGCNQNAKDAADLTGWNKIAKKNGFYVLYPDQKRFNNGSNCFNWFVEKDIAYETGECASVKEMIDYMKANYEIDTNQIYITGLSAGAAMSVAMMALYPTTFKAGAIFSGGPYGGAINFGQALPGMTGKIKKTQAQWSELITNLHKNQKIAYPAIYIYHGKNDPIVNIKNAWNLVSQWTGVQQCDTIPDDSLVNFKNIHGFNCYSYKNNNGKPVAKLYTIKGLGHAYPIKRGEVEDEGGKKGLFSAEIGFHATWQAALDFGLIIK
jgi:poly(hydroxyalkanoate) depolymerase family esterase